MKACVLHAAWISFLIAPESKEPVLDLLRKDANEVLVVRISHLEDEVDHLLREPGREQMSVPAPSQLARTSYGGARRPHCSRDSAIQRIDRKSVV